jgi:hypothetical protein
MQKHPGTGKILGGDWNTTWDISDPDGNIDIANMARPPNLANGKLLKTLAENHDLTEPFRVLHPNKTGFSYVPFGGVRRNRSRIDFFIISSGLVNSAKKAWISASHLSSMFDDKPIFLSFKTSTAGNSQSKKTLKNWFLDEPLIKMTVELSALQIYSFSICPNDNVNTPILARLRDAINFLTANLLSAISLKEKISLEILENNYNLNELLLAAKIGEHNATIDELPCWAELDAL